MRFLLLLLLACTPLMAAAQHTEKPLQHYLAGAVPERDGMVVFEDTIAVPHLSKAQIYERLHAFTTGLIEVEQKLPASRITAQSPSEGLIVATIEEYIWFKRTALAWDRALMRYQLVFSISDGAFVAIMRNIRYNYEGVENPGTDTDYRAEDWITDREALSRNGRKLTRVAGRKFRVKTIDRKDEIFAAAAASCR